MVKSRTEYIPVDKVVPYEKNPRLNDDSVADVAKSIHDFGFRGTITLDKDFVIASGHTRIKACKFLLEQGDTGYWGAPPDGMSPSDPDYAKYQNLAPMVPYEQATLSAEEIRAYRLADNKVAEGSGWDFEMLAEEITGLKGFGFDMEDFGFIDYDRIDNAPMAPDDARAVDTEDDEIEFISDPGEGISMPRMGGRSVTVFCDSDDDVMLLKNALDEMGYRYR